MTPLLTDTLKSPIGCLVLVFDAGRLCALDYADSRRRMTRLLQRRYHQFRLCAASKPLDVTQQLRAYLGGKLDAIDSIQVGPRRDCVSTKSLGDAADYSAGNHTNLS